LFIHFLKTTFKGEKTMTLVKFNNRNNALIPGVNDVFESIFNDSFLSDRMVTRVPAVNISESADHYHIELAAPGLKKQDFKISIADNVLNISVELQTDQNTNDRKYNKREYSYSSFVRSFTLPELADQGNVQAAYENGVLKIDVAKKEEAKTVSRQIELK
jgi:HSP20 family protein